MTDRSSLKGGTITDVQTQKRSAARRSLFVDGEYMIGVAEETYVKFALFRGRDVTTEFLQDVFDWDESYRARNSALRLANVRSRSVSEMKERLGRKGFSPAAIDSAIAFLFEYGMLDDAAFARAFVHDRLLKKALGRRKLEMDLRAKGLAPKIIEQVLDELTERIDMGSTAISAAMKKWPNIRGKDLRSREQKLIAFLTNRGFEWPTIRTAVDAVRNATENEGNEQYEDQGG